MRFIRTLMSRKGKPIDFKAIEPEITALCRQFKIDLFYIFGSYASGKPGLLSDIDIAYFSKHKINPLKLLPHLQDLFKEEALDLVDLSTAPPALVHQVLKKGKCLYSKDLKAKIDFEMKAECEYYDTAHLRKTFFASMLRRIENGTYGLR
ncbi:MAG: nucleotidyltransferase domain-containing protein [Nanoarchaeota archaeon]